MNLFRNGIIAVFLLLMGGCMMMDMHKPHGTAMETTSTGHAAETKNAPPATNPAEEKKEPAAASHSSMPSGGMAVVGGVLMVVMMLAMML